MGEYTLVKYHSVWVKLVECYVWETLMEHHVWVMLVEWHAWVISMLVDYRYTVQVCQVVVHKLAERPTMCPSSTTLSVPWWHNNQMAVRTSPQQPYEHLQREKFNSVNLFISINSVAYQMMAVIVMCPLVYLCLSPTIVLLLHHNTQNTYTCIIYHFLYISS